MPEIDCELVGAVTDNPPLGIGEASGGPTVAAIGNAVAHALGARIRDLPMTRERVMAALLQVMSGARGLTIHGSAMQGIRRTLANIQPICSQQVID